ncbi:MAG: phosphoglucosamine mutase [Planctomycetes bacterium]|nr:phosphoglucosamine mutase [Planctomycetota bacterium]MBT4029613.1 phosphoglucosamine mutase [Planctomycetota bacterium]MBT4560518.1 phosphoglucosamine mutase [Planctomycetota bacterium]MBT5100989.1 phosphoglucosamine mutase [Planctomycetota bacterium]MBT5120192.1 phosphoglucosamine mutase [Planctomycetota bacterium]
MTRQFFGTDGIRGRAGEYPLQPELLTRLGHVLGLRVRRAAQQGDTTTTQVVIGHDGRESGEPFAAALAEGLARAGVHVDVLGLATTPCIAFITAHGDYSAGIVVSASHNPAHDNGVKLLNADGSKLGDTVEIELESELLCENELTMHSPLGEIRRAKNLVADYIGWLRADAFPDLDLKGWRVLVDCANGAASQIAQRILKAFGAEPVVIHDKPDGSNINADCGALHAQAAADAAKEHDCVLGVSLDGDADRGILVDGSGRILDGDVILAGLGSLLSRSRSLAGDRVTATVMSNLALERWLSKDGVSLHRTQVGDRYVSASMRATGGNLGGEKSGHILFGSEHGFRGDGLYTFLKIAQAICEAGLEPSDFAKGYADFPQELRNLPATRRAPMSELPALSAACAAIDAELQGRGRTVVRFSGTELLLRLMVEAETQNDVSQSLDTLEAAAREDGILA